MSKQFDKDLLRLYMMGAANPSGGKVQFSAAQAVDLHMDDEGYTGGKKDEKYILEHQIELFEKSIDQAIASGKSELRIIHGNGKGVLKKEVHKLLKRHPHVASFDDAHHPKYGYGSTIVYFFWQLTFLLCIYVFHMFSTN